MGIMRIAIDGPSASGKSTAAKNLSKALGIEYIDTGAMYRAAAYKAKLTSVPVDDDEAVGKMMDETDIDFVSGSVYLDGANIDGKIRNIEISSMASAISKLPSCRGKLVDIQRKIASSKSVVMDGRDIGTNVLKDAEYKFFVTADLDVRTDRRYQELLEKGDKITREEVYEDLRQRDINDTTRALNPLKKADDAVEISTDGINIEETTSVLLSYIKEKEDQKS